METGSRDPGRTQTEWAPLRLRWRRGGAAGRGPEAARPREVGAANPRAASGIPPRGTEHVSLHEQWSAPRAPPPRRIKVRAWCSRTESCFGGTLCSLKKKERENCIKACDSLKKKY